MNKNKNLTLLVGIVACVIFLFTVTVYVIYHIDYETSEEKVDVIIPKFTLPLVYGEEKPLIPEWIKGVTSYWIEGSITDEKFIQVLEFLIEHEVIVIPGYGKIDIQEEVIIPMVFSLNTDKDTYTKNERIVISGTLPNDDVVDVIVMMIRSVDEVGVDMMTITNDKSGNYETYMTAGIHDAMLKDGDYYIRAQYQGERLTKTFTFTAK